MRERSAGGGAQSERGASDEVILAAGKRRDAFLRVIRAAEKRLLVSLFRCTDFPILDAIGDALARRVEVRVLLTPRARGWETRLKELRAYLESMGAEVRAYADPVMKYHAKYVVADDGPALVGSLNLTAKCFGATCDFILVTRDRGVADGLRDIFEADWRAPDSTFPEWVTPRLIVGPDRARAQLTAFLESAEKSISIIDHKLTDPAMRQLLKEKEAAGVAVKTLGAGELGGLLAHGKLILVDGRRAALGSMSLSALSMDFRREIAVFVEEPREVRKLREFFGRMAAGGEAAVSGNGNSDEQ